MDHLKILVVEDESIVARDIQYLLKRLGFDVSLIAFTGKEAIEKTEEAHPDLVLMDIKLKKDMDGIETAEQIRARFDIPIIFISALSDEESLSRARKIEPYFFISKPVEEGELQAVIEKAYSKHNICSKSEMG